MADAPHAGESSVAPLAGAIVVPLLDGFEEIEAVTIIDVLRRADLPVRVAGARVGPVRGAHGIEVSAEVALADLAAAELGAAVLPGGMPGAEHLAANPEVQRLLTELGAGGKYTCAICAAPMALAAAGLLRGRRATCFPGFEERMGGAELAADRVVVDGLVVTSRGAGTAMEFALTLVGLWCGIDERAALAARMLARLD